MPSDPVTLEAAEYERLIRLIQAVDLAQAQAALAVQRAAAARDAAWTDVRAAHPELPAHPARLSWDDETRQIRAEE